MYAGMSPRSHFRQCADYRAGSQGATLRSTRRLAPKAADAASSSVVNISSEQGKVLVPTVVGMISLVEDGQVLSGLLASPAVILKLVFDLLTSFQWR